MAHELTIVTQPMESPTSNVGTPHSLVYMMLILFLICCSQIFLPDKIIAIPAMSTFGLSAAKDLYVITSSLLKVP
jgi:hypothetical protein